MTTPAIIKLQSRIRPMPNRAVIKRDGALTQSGRIIIPDKAKRRPTTGTVVEVGSEITKVKPGDRIVFGQWTGTEIGLSNKNNPTEVDYFLIASEDEIVGFLDSGEEVVEQGA